MLNNHDHAISWSHSEIKGSFHPQACTLYTLECFKKIERNHRALSSTSRTTSSASRGFGTKSQDPGCRTEPEVGYENGSLGIGCQKQGSKHRCFLDRRDVLDRVGEV